MKRLIRPMQSVDAPLWFNEIGSRAAISHIDEDVRESDIALK